MGQRVDVASFPLSPATSWEALAACTPAFPSHHLFISPAELVMSMVASSLPVPSMRIQLVF